MHKMHILIPCLFNDPPHTLIALLNVDISDDDDSTVLSPFANERCSKTACASSYNYHSAIQPARIVLFREVDGRGLANHATNWCPCVLFRHLQAQKRNDSGKCWL